MRVVELQNVPVEMMIVTDGPDSPPAEARQGPAPPGLRLAIVRWVERINEIEQTGTDHDCLAGGELFGELQ